jgi:hypothetical protein
MLPHLKPSLKSGRVPLFLLSDSGTTGERGFGQTKLLIGSPDLTDWPNFA